MAKKKSAVKFQFATQLYEAVLGEAEVTRKGEVRIRRSEFKRIVSEVFEDGLRRAAGGERVKFPAIGALVRKDVKAKKAGKGINPFTGDPMDIKARPASKKPRWSFPKSAKLVFAEKKNW